MCCSGTDPLRECWMNAVYNEHVTQNYPVEEDVKQNQQKSGIFLSDTCQQASFVRSFAQIGQSYVLIHRFSIIFFHI